MQPQILYLFDPLCGWCYGFSDTIYQFSQKYASDYEFVPIPGGMVTGERVQPISTMESYISGAFKRVEEMTGCEFGKAYTEGLLKSETVMMDSEPPSRALITFRTFNGEKAIAFAKALQTAHYKEGRDYNDLSLYRELASSFGIDADVFMSRFEEEKMKQHVQQEFAWVKESGVQGYPTVVLRHGQQYYMISNGFVPLQELESTLEKAKARLLKAT
jgi:putative protein-disulfide isomerase